LTLGVLNVEFAKVGRSRRVCIEILDGIAEEVSLSRVDVQSYASSGEERKGEARAGGLGLTQTRLQKDSRMEDGASFAFSLEG
jgi:hypothetical protein